MITFIASLLLLVVGYCVYGRFVETAFGPDNRQTPAVTMADGVDYIVLPGWKIFMIQFLNIAGTGPIFGAIMGIWYGPAAYLWIVLGCIFAGAMHDYLSGMISMRNGGCSLPETIGIYLGGKAKSVMLIFSVILLVMVGAVFVLSPASLLAGLCKNAVGGVAGNLLLWIFVIFIYYIIATMMPVDKIIGKIYPLFAMALIFMASGLMVMLFIHFPALPELWDGLGNMGMEKLGIKDPDPMFPALFITIACGAISGFHATQTPLMARCVKSEKMCRPIFYGAMITEGIIALVWATVASYFFYADGWREVLTATAPGQLAEVERQLAEGANITQVFGNAAEVVMIMCNSWLGAAGGVLAILGVVAAPITSGDTALRSARLIIAEYLHIDQKPVMKRLYICIPMFALTIAFLVWQMENKDGFNIIWKYFGWANQTLSVFTLWAITVYLTLKGKCYWISLVPAVFMTVVCTTFLCISEQAMNMNYYISYTIGVLAGLCSFIIFLLWKKRRLSAGEPDKCIIEG
ncbi:MAG: carbon starvation protein A [Bacteroidales bacterium]|nr:carbon starvation protein A [Bacteroidales bacterium]MCM1146683.1 carbon starvation protein A [Bacteroidales bacterium]MCM1205500.1 carbon starvation protein A [Bacillota bacterium]MCM1509239.1 carbon starvation protein A [Clostridium sp.]